MSELGGQRPQNNSPERATSAPRSPKRRAKRGRAAKLDRLIQTAQEEVLEARRDGHHELADRIGDRMATLDIDLRRVLLAKEHGDRRRLAAELGITADRLAAIVARFDRAHAAAPDENPTAAGSPYRGNRWRSQLGRGGKGAMAR
jgi:hypothetical protein